MFKGLTAGKAIIIVRNVGIKTKSFSTFKKKYIYIFSKKCIFPSFFSLFHSLYIKLCENIGIFIKKSTNPGSNKVVYGPCEQESEEKNSKFRFFNMQNRTFVKKKLLVKIKIFFYYAFMYLERSVLMSRFQK